MIECARVVHVSLDLPIPSHGGRLLSDVSCGMRRSYKGVCCNTDDGDEGCSRSANKTATEDVEGCLAPDGCQSKGAASRLGR